MQKSDVSTRKSWKMVALRQVNWLGINFIKIILKNKLSRVGVSGTDQTFIIGCRYFMKKHQLPVRTKTLLFAGGIFLVIFLFPCDIVVICLCPTYQEMMV